MTSSFRSFSIFPKSTKDIPFLGMFLALSLLGCAQEDSNDTNTNGKADGWGPEQSCRSCQADLQFWFGNTGDIAVSGDWNGDGRIAAGVFRSVEGRGQWSLDYDGNGIWNPSIDKVYYFGNAGDKPVVGDWAGLGYSSLGVFRDEGDAGQWSLDYDGDGAWNAQLDQIRYFGNAGDTPVSGDWAGSGTTAIGVFRDLGNAGYWTLDFDGDGVWNATNDRVHYFGNAGDTPVVGDWAGLGTSAIGVVRSVGDASQWSLDSDASGTWEPTRDRIHYFGGAEDQPLSFGRTYQGQTLLGVFRSQAGGLWNVDSNGNGIWDESL